MTDHEHLERVALAATPELLPCPFCESDAAVVGYGPYTARCKRCTASLGPLFTLTPNEAVAAWNRRASRSADTDALVAALDDIREAVEEGLMAYAETQPTEELRMERMAAALSCIDAALQQHEEKKL